MLTILPSIELLGVFFFLALVLILTDIMFTPKHLLTRARMIIDFGVAAFGTYAIYLLIYYLS